jgi:DME family drug/metabolite transporter
MSGGSNPGYIGGALLALAAGTMWSFGGITVRYAPDSDSWQYLIWRSVGLLVAVEAWSLARGQGLLLARFARSMADRQWIDLVAALALTLAAGAFVYALKATTIANAIFFASVTPLISMVLARTILAEALTWPAVVAIGLGLAGLAVMVGGDFGRGTLGGDLVALLSSLGFAIYSICVRLAPRRDFSPTLSAYALLSLLLCCVVTLVNGRPLAPPPQDIAMALLHGAVFIGIGIPLFNRAAPRVPAVGLVVLAQTETILSPIWAWLIIGEVPALTTLAGGALILSGVVLTAVAGARRAARDRHPGID